MATSKKGAKSTSKNENVTRVVCQNCGAEILIPDHEHEVSGTAIGKDSGLGTVVLPTSGGGSNVDIEALFAKIKGDKEALKAVISLAEKIENDGYLDVDGIVRRWIPSQCLHMVYCERGFHLALLGRGYDYSWKVLVDELKRQCKLYTDKDDEGFKERNRWYNQELVIGMAKNYIACLREHIDWMKPRSHKGRTYKKVHIDWLNNGKGIHLDELPTFFRRFEILLSRIAATKSPKVLCETVMEFDKLRKGVKVTFNSYMYSGFINAYKAAGAYYTIKDLIMFEGCLMKLNEQGSTGAQPWRSKREFINAEKSLKALEEKADEIVVSGVNKYGYEMLGLLRDFLDYNQFNFDDTKDKWAEQTAIRKALRSSKRGERRSRK